MNNNIIKPIREGKIFITNLIIRELLKIYLINRGKILEKNINKLKNKTSSNLM